jgi:WD40 repeat protein
MLEEFVTSMFILPNNILVCGLENGKIIKWNLNNFSKIDSFKAHKSVINNIKHVSLSQIVSCSNDKKIKLWNVATNVFLRTFNDKTDQVSCLEISFDKTKLYSGGWFETLRVWDISSGQCLKVINLNGALLCLKLLSINYMAVGLHETKENLNIIDLNSHEIVKSIQTQSESVHSLNFNRNKNELFVGSNDGPIRMFQF